MAITIEQEQELELKQEALTVTQKAALVEITDQLTYNSASALLLETIIPFRKRWKDYWETLRKPAYEAYQGIIDKFKEGDKPAAAAEKVVKDKIRVWDAQQKAIEEELQRKAQEKAEREAQEERLNAAVVAEQSGATKDEVDDIFHTLIAVVAPPVTPSYLRASGISNRENWKAHVLDVKKLCLAVAKEKVSAEYILPNMTALNARAKADKQTMNIPGCVAKNEPIVAGRTK